MDTNITLIVTFSVLIILLSIIWMYRIKSGKKDDPDWDRRDDAMHEDERTNPDT